MVLNDDDPVETRKWLDSLRAVVQYQGPERARYLVLSNNLIEDGDRLLAWVQCRHYCRFCS
jgi:pyruvate dehydrogenase complex dehydrogenase (E1) component